MEDGDMENLTPTARCSEEHSISSIDLKKKRKLQYDLGILDMPSPNQRLKMGPNIFVEALIGEAQDDFERREDKSENDSNSFIKAYETSMASDVKVADENSITLTILQEQLSTSLNSYNKKVNKCSHYSLESRGFKEMSDATTADLEEILQLELGYKVAEEMHSSFESVNAILELESDDEAKTESMILYSNDVAPHSFLRSSGCWNLGRDVPLCAKKPTIDQEFEQYFSSLML